MPLKLRLSAGFCAVGVFVTSPVPSQKVRSAKGSPGPLSAVRLSVCAPSGAWRLLLFPRVLRAVRAPAAGCAAHRPPHPARLPGSTGLFPPPSGEALGPGGWVAADARLGWGFRNQVGGAEGAGKQTNPNRPKPSSRCVAFQQQGAWYETMV